VALFLWPISTFMKFKISTLVDITETNVRRGNSFDVKQQQNFLTFLQVLGLRINPFYERSPVQEKSVIDNLGFGKKYKGKQNLWSFVFETEYNGGLTVDMLKDDFDLVPIIPKLNESVEFDTACFNSKDENYTNILFEDITTLDK